MIPFQLRLTVALRAVLSLRSPFCMKMKPTIQDGIINSPFPAPPCHSETLFDFLQETVEAHKLKTAWIEGERTVSYAEFFGCVRSCAAGLQHLGVGRGDRVHVCTGNNLDGFIATCAIGCTGAAIVFSEPEADYLRSAGVTHILTDGARASALPRNDQCHGIKHWLSIGDVPGFTNILSIESTTELEFVVANGACSDDVLLVGFSSGTTGIPKAIDLSARSLLTQTAARKLAKFVTPDDRVFVRARIYQFFGFIKTFTTIHCGATVVMDKSFPVLSSAVAVIKSHKVTRLIGSPLDFRDIMDSLALTKSTAPSLKAIMCAAVAPGPDMVKAAIAVCPSLVEMRSVYGMTEMSGPLTAQPPGLISAPNSVGFPMPGTRIKVVSIETGDVLGPMEVGEVLVYSNTFMRGYTQETPETAASFTQDGWMRTGDVGFYGEDGSLYLKERLKMLIRSSGSLVFPCDIEGLLTAHPDVLDAAVVGVPTLGKCIGAEQYSRTEEQVPAALVVVANRRSPDKRFALELKEYVAERANPSAHLRGGIFFVSSIPRTYSGKTVRRKLLAILQSLHLDA